MKDRSPTYNQIKSSNFFHLQNSIGMVDSGYSTTVKLSSGYYKFHSS